MKKFFASIIVISMILSLMIPVTAFGAEGDLIFSESFEGVSETALPSGWSYFGNKDGKMCAYASELYTDGKNSAVVIDKSDSLAGGFSSPYIEVKENAVYTASVNTFVYEGTSILFFKFFDENKKQISYKSKRYSTIGKWGVITISEAIPAGAKYASLSLGGTIADITHAAYDNVKFYEGKVDASLPDAKNIKVPVVEEKPKEKLPPIPEGEIYTQSFEASKDGALPEGWSLFGNKGAEMTSFSADRATLGSVSAFVSDKDAANVGGFSSSYIEVVAGYPYTAIIDTYLLEGSAAMFLKYYDANKKQLSSKTISTSKINTWSTITTNATAPEGTVYMNVVLGGTKAGTTVAYYDNLRLYSGVKKLAPVKAHKEFAPPVQKDAATSKLITPSGDKLVYTPYNEQGDSLTDFSYAGFYGGKYELPDTSKLPVAATVEPSSDPNADDTARLQEIINKVYADASNDYMKVIKLKAGKYNINKSGLWLKSGIVLVGEGQGPDGTIIYGTDPVQYVVVNIKGIAPSAIGNKVYITDDYVKAGSYTVNVEDASEFKVGDLVSLYRPGTDEWNKAMEMDAVKDPYNGNKNSWRTDTVNSYRERTITKIDGNKITFDMPVYVPLMKEYSPCYIQKINDELKIKHVGIENLRIDSYYNGDFDDENHAKTGIEFENAKDCFVRNVSFRHFVFAGIQTNKYSKQITILNCSYLDPVSQITGSRRYSFVVANPAQQILTYNCYSYDSRHDYATTRQATGPIVYLDSVNDESNDSTEPHGTWTTGLLYDNIFGIANGNDGILAMSNRGLYGTDLSQGWTVGGGVAWNILQTLAIGHKPPLTYQNFMIGAWGVYTDKDSLSFKQSNLKRVTGYYRTSKIGKEDDKTPYGQTSDDTFMAGNCYMESETAPVEPRSLFKAQLSERLTGSYKNVKPNAPVIVYPRSEETSKDTDIEFTGLYQKGATKVKIYIDNKPYEATLNNSDYTFKLKATLEKGVHKIYATQVIDGVEGVKCADRFLTVVESTGNKDYLQSTVDFEKTGLILNDPRLRFDAYQAERIAEEADKISVIVNDVVLVSDVEPFETKGRVLVPMRAIFEALEATVSWDEKTATATATNGVTTVKITENQTTAYVNDKAITLDVPATIVNGRFVVPVRFISESFGAKVGWQDKRKIVTISGGKAKYDIIHNLPGELRIYDATEPADKIVGDPISKALDGSFATSWSLSYEASAPEWANVVFDLGAVKEINLLKIAFFKGTERIYTFEIYLSEDGVNYTKALDKTNSSDSTLEFQDFVINGKGRYVKFVGYGNNKNAWNNISELSIIGK